MGAAVVALGGLAAGLVSTAVPSGAVVAGAGYTTFVVGDQGDCLDSKNGVNGNNYADSKASS
jgi:hypothetical protein